jgi:hypothetical protein
MQFFRLGIANRKLKISDSSKTTDTSNISVKIIVLRDFGYSHLNRTGVVSGGKNLKGPSGPLF